jgi:predicted fused transcriptional regulator/phosphomethylpyrimidine kinase
MESFLRRHLGTNGTDCRHLGRNVAIVVRGTGTMMSVLHDLDSWGVEAAIRLLGNNVVR